MMGQQPRMESLFYYFRLEDQIPEDHLLRLIDRYVDFRFVRERLKNFYSLTGRPSIDPEVLLRLLLVGYLYGLVHWQEPAREVVRALAGTAAYVRSQRARRKIEALFSELKQRLGLRRVRLRRLWNVAEQFFLAATAQNLKRLVRFLAQRRSSPALSTA